MNCYGRSYSRVELEELDRTRAVVTHTDWPYRVEFVGAGPMTLTCDQCGKLHWNWLTDDRVWRRIPDLLQDDFFCVDCFRQVFLHATGLGAR